MLQSLQRLPPLSRRGFKAEGKGFEMIVKGFAQKGRAGENAYYAQKLKEANEDKAAKEAADALRDAAAKAAKP